MSNLEKLANESEFKEIRELAEKLQRFVRQYETQKMEKTRTKGGSQ